MTSGLFLGIVVPILALFAVQVAMFGLHRLLQSRNVRYPMSVLRPLRSLALVFIVLYLLTAAVGPSQTWKWYSSSVSTPQRDILLAIAGVAITAWSGCLIAFAVRKRLTAELSRGLRFMVYACFTPLVALTESGIALRTFAFGVAILAAFWTLFQLRRGRRKMKLDLKVAPWVEDANAPPPSSASIEEAAYMQNFLRDRLAEVLLGWPWSAMLCALAIIVLANASEGAVVGCSLAALLTGLTLAFVALVLPSTGESGLIL
jgi:hypothetical protein